MAERTISVKLLDDITECSICTESYSDPRSLPCVHTFCLKCITKWSGDKLSGDSVDCPLCRTGFTVPDRGIGALPKNIFIGKLLAMKAVSSSTTANAKLCDWCMADPTLSKDKKNKATMFCINCQERLCERCGEIHSKTKISRSHRTVSLDEEFDTRSAILPTFCDLHSNEEVKIYCLACQEALCLVCSITQHSGHKSAEIAKVASEFKQELSRNISELEVSMRTIAETLRNLQDKRQEIDKQFIKVEKDVIVRADLLKETIESHKQQLLAELNIMRTGKFKEIDNTVGEIIRDEALIDSFAKYTEELLKKGSNSDIARESRDLMVRSTELKQLCVKDCNIVLQDTDVSFKPAEVLPKGDTNVVGTICHQGSEKMLQEAKSAETFNPSQSTAETVRNVIEGEKLCPTLTFSFSGNNGVQAVCSFNGQLYVTRISTKQIEVYDTSTFTLQRRISLPDVGNFLNGLAACSTNNCLYVSDNQKDKVYRVNLSATDTTSTTNWSVGRGPRGLSVNKSHNLLVASAGEKKIQEYTSKGSLVRQISVDSFVWHAVELNSGHIAVSQYAKVHGVSVMSVDGKVLKRYGSSTRGSGPGQMNGPSSLAVDSEGFILAADENNNRILVLNPALTEARQLPLPARVEPMRFPRGFYFDESLGRLYVGEFGGQGRLLVFDNVFSVGSLF